MGMFRYCVGGACLRFPCTSSRTRTCTTVMEPSGASDCQAHTVNDESVLTTSCRSVEMRT